MPKKSDNEAPKVTNIPLPASDNPLVIDLPDGQKIVVGKLQTGSVIEVATWRGTGRPDSRTSRLMMGMNTASANANNEASPNPQPKPKLENKFDLKTLKEKVLKALSSASQSIKNWNLSRKAKAKKTTELKSQTTQVGAQPKPLSTPNVDVDEWLAKIIEKSERRREQENKKIQAEPTATKKSVKSRPSTSKSRSTKTKKSR